MNLIQTLEMVRNTETYLNYIIKLKENGFQLLLGYLFYFQGFNQEESVHHRILECSTSHCVSQKMFLVHY